MAYDCCSTLVCIISEQSCAFLLLAIQVRAICLCYVVPLCWLWLALGTGGVGVVFLCCFLGAGLLELRSPFPVWQHVMLSLVGDRVLVGVAVDLTSYCRPAMIDCLLRRALLACRLHIAGYALCMACNSLAGAAWFCFALLSSVGWCAWYRRCSLRGIAL